MTGLLFEVFFPYEASQDADLLLKIVLEVKLKFRA